MADPELTVVIPTRGRRAILRETLARLQPQAAEAQAEVVVVVDGPDEGSAEDARRAGARVIEQAAAGPAAARNRGIAVAAAPVCMFTGDDILPREGLLRRHVAHHRADPSGDEALLGRVVPAPPLDAAPFIVWLHEQGVQFAYAALVDGAEVDPRCFWTANVSVATARLRSVGGFDEAFATAACEDTDLGLRLAQAGTRLRYDAGAVGEHLHPTDLRRTLDRMRGVGEAFRLLETRAPELPMPRRPGLRHRVKAGLLTVASLARVRPTRIRHETWRFLCDEVQREAFWREPPGAGSPRIGRLLARVAERDPLARPPDPLGDRAPR